jgi:hypothetical protein
MNRWYILAPAFLSALALVLFSDAPGATAEVVAAVQGPASPAPAVRQAGSAPAVSLPRLLDRQSLFPASSTPDVRSDLFAGRDWSPPPAPAESAASEPEAPAFPFEYIGKKREAGAWEVFLAKDESTFVLKEGQVAEQVYQVVRIAPPNLTMVYLPMNHTYTVPIGEAE